MLKLLAQSKFIRKNQTHSLLPLAQCYSFSTPKFGSALYHVREEYVYYLKGQKGTELLLQGKTLPWLATTVLTFVTLKGYLALLAIVPLSMATGIIFNRIKLNAEDNQTPENVVTSIYLMGKDTILFKLLNGKDLEIPYSTSEISLEEGELETMQKYKLGVDLEKVFLDLNVKTPLEEHKLPLLVYTPCTDILDTQRLSYILEKKVDDLEKILPQEKAKDPNISQIDDSNRLICENNPVLLDAEKKEVKNMLLFTSIASAAAGALLIQFDYKILGVLSIWISTGAFSNLVTILDGMKYERNRRCTKMEFIDKETVRVTINNDYSVEGKIATVNLLNWNIWFKVKRKFESKSAVNADLTLRCSILDSKTNSRFYFDLLPCPTTSKVPNFDALEWILMGKTL